MSEPNWQPVICPACKGKGEQYVEYEDEWHSGYETCCRCDGKSFIKINVSELKE